MMYCFLLLQIYIGLNNIILRFLSKKLMEISKTLKKKKVYDTVSENFTVKTLLK